MHLRAVLAARMAAVEKDDHLRLALLHLGNQSGQFLIKQVEMPGKAAVIRHQRFIEAIGFIWILCYAPVNGGRCSGNRPHHLATRSRKCLRHASMIASRVACCSVSRQMFCSATPSRRVSVDCMAVTSFTQPLAAVVQGRPLRSN